MACSQVRVHTSADAITAARNQRANAFTLGKEIIFNRDRYAPATLPGKRLLAHELAHVVQQRSASFHLNSVLSSESSVLETEAQTSAERVLSGQSVGAMSSVSSPMIQRDAETEFVSEAALSSGLEVAGVSSPQKEILAAGLTGFANEMKAQLVDKNKGEAAKERLKELKSPKNLAQLFGGYISGAVLGVLNPLTGLFDLAVFAEKMNDIMAKIAANAITNASTLMSEADEVVASIKGFISSARRSLYSLRQNPLETIRALMSMANEKVIATARGAGQSAAQGVIKSVEDDFQDKPTESWSDIAFKRKEGEALGTPLGTVSSLWDRAKAKVLTASCTITEGYNHSA